MKFSEIPYKRLDFEHYKNNFLLLLKTFEEAETPQIQERCIRDIYQQRDAFTTLSNLAQTRYSIDTKKDFWISENAFFNNAYPSFENLINRFYQALTDARFKTELIEVFGQHLFNIAEFQVKSYSNDIIEEKQKENELITAYTNLITGFRVNINGKEFNMSAAYKYWLDKDRDTRKNAFTSFWDTMEKHQNELDDIYDQLVKTRHKIALKLGFKNYIELGYILLKRIDYTPEMVANYRKQIIEYAVPLVKKFRKKQQNRLGLDHLYDYDMYIDFLSGNPEPAHQGDALVKQAQKVFESLSPETNTFFNFLLQKELMDLKNHPNKLPGGYSTAFDNYKYPFIFSNFNNTAFDVTILTHEAGHAFQSYLSTDYEVSEYRRPPLETAEIHAKSMELFTLPYIELFFGDDADKYRYYLLTRSINSLPLQCTIDHFQHIVYENPEMTPDERADAWKELENAYLPDANHTHDFAKSGRQWQRHMHVYRFPFYYIEYGLAQVCALQFWQKNQDNKNDKSNQNNGNANQSQAWTDFLKLCKEGGTAPFSQAIKAANLHSPFEHGCIESIAQNLEEYIDTIDDTQL